MDQLEKEKNFCTFGRIETRSSTPYVSKHRWGTSSNLIKIFDSFSVSSVSTRVRKSKQCATFKSMRIYFMFWHITFHTGNIFRCPEYLKSQTVTFHFLRHFLFRILRLAVIKPPFHQLADIYVFLSQLLLHCIHCPFGRVIASIRHIKRLCKHMSWGWFVIDQTMINAMFSILYSLLISHQLSALQYISLYYLPFLYTFITNMHSSYT